MTFDDKDKSNQKQQSPTLPPLSSDHQNQAQQPQGDDQAENDQNEGPGGDGIHDDGDYDEEEEEEEDWEDEDDSHLFPTHPAFTIPVEIKPTPLLGKGQYGVFAAQDIPRHTEFWIWTHRVVEIPASQMALHIAEHYAPDDVEGIQCFLRRGFVLPPPYDDCFYSNPDDAATFMNHSSTPNCARPHGTTRLIRAGEELTMDYSGNGNPAWYVDLCHHYGILTPVEIAQEEAQRGGVVQPANYQGPVRNTLLDSLVSFQGL